jgi:hypothetical protein
VYQAPPPPPAVVAPPPGPSAAEIAAQARQRAARLAAQRRAARLAAARLLAAKRAAQKRAAEARAESRSNLILPAARPEPAAVVGAPADSPRTTFAVVLGALASIALVLLAFAAVPVHRVPWYWAERTLVERREQFALSGLMCIAAACVVSVLVLLGA